MLGAMEDRFYRQLQPSRVLKAIGRNAARNKRRAVLVIIGILIFLYFFFDNKGILARIELEQQRKALIEQIKADSTELKNLQAQIKALEGDKKTIEKLAREKYGMVRKGETVYKMKKEEGERGKE